MPAKLVSVNVTLGPAAAKAAPATLAHLKKTGLRVSREGPKVKRRRRQRVTPPRTPLGLPSGPNERWSMDFITDTLAAGRAIRTLNIVDDLTGERRAIEVDTSLPGLRVARVLERLRLESGLP